MAQYPKYSGKAGTQGKDHLDPGARAVNDEKLIAAVAAHHAEMGEMKPYGLALEERNTFLDTQRVGKVGK